MSSNNIARPENTNIPKETQEAALIVKEPSSNEEKEETKQDVKETVPSMENLAEREDPEEKEKTLPDYTFVVDGYGNDENLW